MQRAAGGRFYLYCGGRARARIGYGLSVCVCVWVGGGLDAGARRGLFARSGKVYNALRGLGEIVCQDFLLQDKTDSPAAVDEGSGRIRGIEGTISGVRTRVKVLRRTVDNSTGGAVIFGKL